MILGKLSAFRTSTNCSCNFWQKYFLYESFQQIQNFLAEPGTGFPRDTLKDYPATAELLREFNSFNLCHLPAFQPFNNLAAVCCSKEKLISCKDLLAALEHMSTRSWDKFIIWNSTLHIHKGAVCCHREPGLHAVISVTQNTQQNRALQDSARYWTLITGNPEYQPKYLAKHGRKKHEYFKIKHFKWKKKSA